MHECINKHALYNINYLAVSSSQPCTFSLPGGFTAAASISYVTIAAMLLVSVQCVLIQFCKGAKKIAHLLRYMLYFITGFSVVFIGCVIIALSVSVFSGFLSNSTARVSHPLNCQLIYVICANLAVITGFVLIFAISAIVCCCAYHRNVKIVRKSFPRQFPLDVCLCP